MDTAVSLLKITGKAYALSITINEKEHLTKDFLLIEDGDDLNKYFRMTITLPDQQRIILSQEAITEKTTSTFECSGVIINQNGKSKDSRFLIKTLIVDE